MIQGIRRLHKRLRLGRPVVSVKLRLVHTRVLDEPVTFCVNMQNDPVQRNHRRGQFYEMSELSKLRRIFTEGDVFVDVGANVGNHTLFAAKFLKAGKVIPFEPNPRAFSLLIQNVLVNGLADIVDMTKLGVGVSDVKTGGFAMQDRDRNLGGAKMLEGQGDLDVYPLDDLLGEETPDFIKIDVEGMELQVLAGMGDLLKRCRPVMMIEVDNTVEDTFMKWVAENGYGLINTHQRYRLNKNHLICDVNRLEELRKAFADDGIGANAEAVE